jgi:hypothetical protein
VSDNILSDISLGNRKLFGVALLLSAASLWLAPYLPLVDLPQHAAQVVALQEIWSGNPVYTETFRLNWLAPYTATYLILYALGLVFPIAIASKLLISVAIIAGPLLLARILEELDADAGLAWLAIPGSMGVAFYWGFCHSCSRCQSACCCCS